MTLTLARYLDDQGAQRLASASVVAAAARASARISAMLRRAQMHATVAGEQNVQGEVQKPMDVISNEIFLTELYGLREVSFAISEELPDPVPMSPDGAFAVLFDPLDGSSNLDVNVTVGSIFSVIEAAAADDLLQPGRRQVAAGFAAYGPSTTLVITFGETSALFVLQDDDFVLVDSRLRIPERAPEFAINVSRQRFWDEPTRRYVADCLAGDAGPLRHRYNMRWVGSMVADLHRILMRGGIFLYPTDAETAAAGGRLRLLYEVNPMAMIVEAAAGRALSGHNAALQVTPTHLHQRVGVVLGSSHEVGVYARYIGAAGSNP